MSDWIVKIGEQEYRTRSVEELRQWHSEGRLRPGSVVFHPVLQRWLYPHELEELRGVSAKVAERARSRSSLAKPALIIIGVVVLGAFLIDLLVTTVGRRTPEEEPRDAKAAQERRERIRANMLSEAKKNLAALDPAAPVSEVVQRCSAVVQLDAGSLTADQRSRCAKAHLAVAREQFGGGHIREAKTALDTAKNAGANPVELQLLESKIKVVEDREKKKAVAEARVASEREAKAKAESTRAARKAYAELLRNRFLDQGLDIKVRVEGKNADRITLSFALFNAVWAHRIQKDGLLQELKEMGFKRVNLTDNYDYSVYWDFTKQ